MGIFYITKSVIIWLDITKMATYNQVAVTKLVKRGWKTLYPNFSWTSSIEDKEDRDFQNGNKLRLKKLKRGEIYGHDCTNFDHIGLSGN